MKRAYECGSDDHRISRRSLLAGLIGGAIAAGPGRTQSPRVKAKRLLIVAHNGGLSQLESWDPKPSTVHGGPCQAIATSVPGIHVGEWMPRTARQMHRLLVVRGMSTGDDNHNTGRYMMFTGRRESAGLIYPSVECVAHKFLTPAQHSAPGFVAIGDAADPAFLGPRYGAIKVEAGQPPAHLARPASLSAESDRRRAELRRRFDERFARQRGPGETAAYTHSFEQAAELMRHRGLFDLQKESPRDHDRYGRHLFGQRCLQARRLLEHGVLVVYAGHDGYDSHAENFNVHKDLLEQFDQSFSCLIDDLADRGLLDETLVVAMGEFGRTPTINYRFGRDHWSHAWSIALAGAGVAHGGVHGKTNPLGTEVAAGKVSAAQLFHTFCEALGIEGSGNHEVDGQSIPIADPAYQPVRPLLA